MKKQPTEGVWEWYWETNKETGETDCGVTSARGYSVCRAPRYQNKDQWEADARLIVASKDLLEALILANATLEIVAHISPDEIPKEGSLGQIMRAAIAKATGGAE